MGSRHMIDLQEFLVKSLDGHDRSRERNKQQSIGPSSVGGCRRQVWYSHNRYEKTNLNTEGLAAQLGTFIHAGIADAMRREDPFGDNLLIEQKMFSNDPDCGIESGNIDLFIKDKGMVVDWKTTKKKSLRYFPSQQQRWQVQIYGWLLSRNGYQVNYVSLVAVPRDGDSGDIRAHVEEYDPLIAEEALEWVKDVITRTEAPEPEKPAPYCASYCPFYDPTGEKGCVGIAK